MLSTAGGAKQSSSKGVNSGPLAFVRDSHFMTTTQVRPVVSTPLHNPNPNPDPNPNLG